jgi:vacuole morphology and inheritance protein 14
MIVDLQGVGNVLTDPQIHCLDKHRFGKGNMGYLGMLMFFNTHQCTKHCRALGLVHPKDTQELPEDFKLLRDLDSEEVDLMKKVEKLCDLCRKPFITTQGRYME